VCTQSSFEETFYFDPSASPRGIRQSRTRARARRPCGLPLRQRRGAALRETLVLPVRRPWCARERDRRCEWRARKTKPPSPPKAARARRCTREGVLDVATWSGVRVERQGACSRRCAVHSSHRRNVLAGAIWHGALWPGRVLSWHMALRGTQKLGDAVPSPLRVYGSAWPMSNRPRRDSNGRGAFSPSCCACRGVVSE